jgi:hypothetical protein
MSFFERHSKAGTAFLVSFVVLLSLALFELVLRVGFGLGDPVLYRSSPLFGYRLQPNQLVHRRGAEIKVNNLALRADRDWDSNIENKILFLGNSVTYGGTTISNHQLFSHLAAQTLKGYLGGNAGVNGWGIENIAALVIDDEFLPARTYVSVLQEMDFYRGLSKLAGKPFWSHKPQFAIQELLAAFHHDRLHAIYEGHDAVVSEREKEQTVARACARLKELDTLLKQRGYRHLIYMSTNTKQLFENEPADSLVARYLNENDVHPILIKERDEVRALKREDLKRMFYDWNHLTVEGHALWARIIGNDLQKILPQLTERK